MSDKHLDFANQEIVTGMLVIYAQSGRLVCGEVERLTPKKVFIKDGPSILKTCVFLLGEGWTVKS